MAKTRRSGANLQPVDPASVRTRPLGKRPSKVATDLLARPVESGASVRSFLEGLPRILAADDLRLAARCVAESHRRGRPVVVGLGAHVIKVGLSPILVDLMERGIVTAIAMNGAGIVHDFELAYNGATSEDVASGLEDGSFGMARETGEFLNGAIRACATRKIGIGRAVGEAILRRNLPHQHLSLLATAARLGVPATVHVGVGTDIIHMHPDANGAAIGAGSLLDFHLLAAVVGGLEGGTYLNLGSAVIIPEVFVKALNLARNLGARVRRITCVDMDFIRNYRPRVNVVARPTMQGGRGIELTGHHELMFPLLAAAVLEELEAKRPARPTDKARAAKPRGRAKKRSRAR